MRGRRSCAGLCALLASLCLAAPATAAFDDPIAVFVPEPPPSSGPPPPPKPPPTSYLNGPCGLAVDDDGSLYVADHNHDVVDVFDSSFEYVTQLNAPDPDGGPCALGLDSSQALYLATYHGPVGRFGPSPGFEAGATFGSLATGLAVDPASGRAYMLERDRIAAYEPSGEPVEVGSEPLLIGEGSLDEGYGLAFSTHPATAGRLYAADAAEKTVKGYDPATDADNPVQTLAPPGGFQSLRESALAVDRASGEIYVLESRGSPEAVQPRALVHVFSAAGAYQGHLKYEVIDGAPTGIAVDNSPSPRHPEGTQGRVYLTTGNSHHAGIYAYPPGAATEAEPRPPQVPLTPLGGGRAPSAVEIGSPAGGGLTCEGDDCQLLEPAPTDPSLTTLLPGLGNPPVRYRRAPRRCGPLVRAARRAARAVRRNAPRQRARAVKRRKRARSARRAVKSCRRANRRRGAGASASSVAASGGGVAAPSGAQPRTTQALAAGPATDAPAAASLLPTADGFDATATADGGGAAALAGSHPFALELAAGPELDGPGSDLSELEIELPPGFLINPAATPELCSTAQIVAPRSSPFEASASGESCPARTQVGTVEVASGIGGAQSRRFGLFNLAPPDGAALRLGAAPFGQPLRFDAELRSAGTAAFGLTLRAEIPAALQAEGLSVVLWGAPWDAVHDTERGNCLSEAEPGFAWGKCSAGDPLGAAPLALLTMPVRCGSPLALTLRARTHQAPGTLRGATIENSEPGGEPVPISGCGTVGFDAPGLDAEGVLSVIAASSASGYAFRLANEDEGLADPRTRMRSLPRRAVVELPDGVTLNPSLGAGLIGCSPGQYAAETAFNRLGAGCPDGARIGELEVKSPFYSGQLRGAIYLASPYDNPFDSLIAVYILAKSAERGLLIKAAGEVTPDPRDGTLTAAFENLPDIPYTDLELRLRSGQRAPLVSPPACGPARTRILLSPWAAGAGEAVRFDGSEIETGIGGGPCPAGVPPFSPRVRAGGVNSAVGSYTPYFVRIDREDTEQEIASYSLKLPAGVTGKLAGIPFCPDAAIAAARANSGQGELASPSCPQASRVGRTETGYGVGGALTYARGNVYLAGPYNGRPLSLVTINAATVGPFDLGTVVIRSAFAVDPRSAQLEIDSSASDPIPHSLKGVPLHLRQVRVHIDRPEFTRNPTGCEPSELVSTLTGAGTRLDDRGDDSVARTSTPFGLLECTALEFAPRLGLRLRGGVRRGAYPGLVAVFRPRPEDASLKRIEVAMPPSLFLAQNHIRTVCTREQFAAERCPPGSLYGHAAAVTSLFEEPLRGAVYLRSSEGKLPDLVALLRAGEVRIELQGRIGPSKKGGIRAFFEGVPDAPIERFAMWLRGGRHGLLVNSVNVCKSPPQARVKALAHNNRGAIFTTRLRGKCGKQKAKKNKGRNRRGGRR